MTGSSPTDSRWPMRLPVLLLAAVVVFGCGSCVARAVQAVQAAPDLFPSGVGTDGPGYGPPDTGPLCGPPDPAFVAEFSEDPLITTVPPGAMLRRAQTLESCAGDGGGVASRVEGAPPANAGAVTAHYRQLAVAGGWAVADRPAEGALLSATREWNGGVVSLSLWLLPDGFLVKVTPMPP